MRQEERLETQPCSSQMATMLLLAGRPLLELRVLPLCCPQRCMSDATSNAMLVSIQVGWHLPTVARVSPFSHVQALSFTMPPP